MNLNAREMATVLAALRYWAREGLGSGGHERDIATDGDLLEPLTGEEIAALCERLNAPALPEPTVVVQTDCGAVHAVASSGPVRLIVLDADTEGGEPDEIRLVDDVNYYVMDFTLVESDANGDEADGVSPEFVARVVAQLDEASQ